MNRSTRVRTSSTGSPRWIEIRRAIADMRERGAKGIALLGSTEYYPRFGFRHEPQLTYPGPPAEYFQCLLLDGELPSGEVAYSHAFG